MKDFEPRPYQKNVFKELHEMKVPEIPFPPRKVYFGVDMAQGRGDKTVIARAKMDGKGITSIVFDEYATIPDYKWYRNPIKWWKWRRLMKAIGKQYGRAK